MLGIKRKIRQYFNERGLFLSLEKISISPVGYNCNHNCRMCWRQNLSKQKKIDLTLSNKTDLKIDEYIKLIKSLPKTVKQIDIVGGGEPLLCPNITDIFKIIHIKHLHGRLITNGSLLSPKIIKSLISSNFESIRISFHAATRHTYKKIHGIDHFNQVINNIKYLISHRQLHPQVILYFVIQRDNICEIENFVDLAYKLHVDKIEFGSLINFDKKSACLNPDHNHVIKLLKHIQNKIDIDNNCSDILNEYNSKLQAKSEDSHSINKKYYCPIIYNNLEILANGNAYPCCISIGRIPGLSVREHSIKDVWKMYHNFRHNIIHEKYYYFCESLCPMRLLKQ